jgi:hypothetical protein
MEAKNNQTVNTNTGSNTATANGQGKPAGGILNGSENKKSFWKLYIDITTYIAGMVIHILVLRFFINVLREHYADKRKAALLKEKRLQQAEKKRKAKRKKKQAKKRTTPQESMNGIAGAYHTRFN